MYHHVAPHPGDMVTVTPASFEGQMRHLARNGYAALSLEELLSAMRGEWTPPKKAVAITFDDGWMDNYVHAYPVLVKYRIRAAVFVATGWVDRASEGGLSTLPTAFPLHREARRMAESGETRGVIVDWDRVAEMSDSGFVDFYSHTANHARCGRLGADAVAEELGGSKRALEERLGRPCLYLCWPFGEYSAEAVALAKAAGYRALFTTRPGVVREGTDPFAIPRIVIKDQVEWFRRRTRLYTLPWLSSLYLSVKMR